MFAAYFAFLILAALVVLACARWPHLLGRVVVAGLFLGAGVFTLTVAAVKPLLFIENFGPEAIPLYREFIYGPFMDNPFPYVVLLALGQLVCGLAVLFGHGVWVRLGLLGCIAFLLAITGLGLGCGFPANLVTAVGPALLLGHRFEHRALVDLQRWLHLARATVPAAR